MVSNFPVVVTLNILNLSAHDTPPYFFLIVLVLFRKLSNDARKRLNSNQFYLLCAISTRWLPNEANLALKDGIVRIHSTWVIYAFVWTCCTITWRQIQKFHGKIYVICSGKLCTVVISQTTGIVDYVAPFYKNIFNPIW